MFHKNNRNFLKTKDDCEFGYNDKLNFEKNEAKK